MSDDKNGKKTRKRRNYQRELEHLKLYVEVKLDVLTHDRELKDHTTGQITALEDILKRLEGK